MPQLISYIDQAEHRLPLLEKVIVDHNGVALCNGDEEVMRLAAVRVADGGDAVHIPFVQQGSELQLPLPADRPSKIGFFIGHSGVRIMSATVRLGNYPGEPLTTTTSSTGVHNEEVAVSLAGIKDQELDEENWAAQINLFDQDGLGFQPKSTRGIFSRAHQEYRGSRAWKTQRLVVVPPSMEDLVEMPDATTYSTVVQILGQEVLAPRRRPYPRQASPYDYGNFGMMSVALPSRRDSLSLGFGRPYSTDVHLEAIRYGDLFGAFEVAITAAEE